MRAGFLLFCQIFAFLFAYTAERANALEAIDIPINASIVDLTNIVERHLNKGDRVQVSTAPDVDGIVRRIEVRSEKTTGSSDWIVFALANSSNEQIDRLLVAPRYRLVGSGLIWPDLGQSRIGGVTPSQGFAPERLPDDQADIYRITLDPGAIVTFVAELNTPRLPELQLWQVDAYKTNVNSFTLYRGIIIGIAGLLALFLTVLFVVKGTAMFPATAMLAWAVLAYISIDFGFWNRAFGTFEANEQSLRATTEVVLAGALVVFLYTYLHLHRWHVRYSHLTLVWLFGIVVLSGVILIDPAIAAGIARFSVAATGVLGLFIVFYLALHNYDRAIMLIPTWLVLVFWLAAAWLAVTGQLDNSIVQPALAGGLVLIVMLTAFTIMQHAFAGGALAQGLLSDAEQKALALIGAGHAIWDWDVARDRITVGTDVEEALGLKPGGLAGPARNWLGLIHPGDRDRFRLVLDTIVNHRRGRINQTFRMRADDGHYLWFSLRARPIIGSDGEVMRCAGTIGDVTDQKFAEERLLHDSIYDNLTGLPNRQLLIDRLDMALNRAEFETEEAAPSVLVIDVDDFRAVNDEFSITVGDSVILAIARRLSRVLRPQDSIARLQGDAFAVLLFSETGRVRIDAFAKDLVSAVRAAIPIADRELFLNASVGVAQPEPEANAVDHLRQAEAACYHAKRMGGGRVEFFRTSLGARTNRLDIEKELPEAIDSGDISLVYQPIIRLADQTISGYEALMRWEHAQRGAIPPGEFIPLAEEKGMIVQLGLFALEQAARDLASWQNLQPLETELFVSVNVSSRQLLRHDLINDVKSVLARSGVSPETLKLEITESLVMANPEYSAQMLAKIREQGVGLSLDDFGTGYSALSYLQRFPFDTLKVDKSFVRGNGSSTRPIILRSIVSLAHDLGMAVVAEGVETDGDSLELQQIGCDFAQGYLFGKPMSADEVRRMIEQGLSDQLDEPEQQEKNAELSEAI